MNTSISYLKYIAFLFVGISCSQLAAQNSFEKCGQLKSDSLQQTDQSFQLNTVAFEYWIRREIESAPDIQTRSVLTIPVVVHVVHNGEPIGSGANISYEQVLSQIEVLNEDFQRLPGSRGFNDHQDGADIGIEFCLAEVNEETTFLDEPGIHRYNGSRNSWTMERIESELKAKTIWEPNQYFNIWTVSFNSSRDDDIVGYAQFPSVSGLSGLALIGGAQQTDGVVVDYRAFGSLEKGNFPALEPPYHLGRVATHEIGHWLGLRHIWGDGGCGVDDYCDDTPSARAANYDCGRQSSCGSFDMVENYMDYSSDTCMNIFTQDQKARMLAVLENSPRRKKLLESTVCTSSLSLRLADSKVEVFPNPTKELINIRLVNEEDVVDDAEFQLSLSDVSGKELLLQSMNVNETKSIIISHLSSGIYFLRIYNNTFSKVEKIIKI